MTANQFRKLALGLPDVREGAHHAHPDFRVGGKIFASLWPDGEHGMVKLTVEQQAVLVGAEPAVYQPVNGAWGRRGCTRVVLKAAERASLQAALSEAWNNVAPPRERNLKPAVPAPRRQKKKKP